MLLCRDRCIRSCGGFDARKVPGAICRRGTVSKENQISIYVPQDKQVERPIERLDALAKARSRSANYLVVEAILEYLDANEPMEHAPHGPRTASARPTSLQPKRTEPTTRPRAEAKPPAAEEADREPPLRKLPEPPSVQRRPSPAAKSTGCLVLLGRCLGLALGIAVVLCASPATATCVLGLFGSTAAAMQHLRM
jgi:predicted DNA-binding protein